MTTTDRSLADVLAAGDAGALDDLVADDVRFRSPYADYDGRTDVVHLLGLIARVLEQVTVLSRGRQDDGAQVTQLTTTVGDQELQGVIVERHDDSGRLAEAMLLLRPFAGLRTAMAAMGALMEDDPLPSLG